MYELSGMPYFQVKAYLTHEALELPYDYMAHPIAAGSNRQRENMAGAIRLLGPNGKQICGCGV